MSAYADRLEALVADAADRCTGCGKCFEACRARYDVSVEEVRTTEENVVFKLPRQLVA